MGEVGWHTMSGGGGNGGMLRKWGMQPKVEGEGCPSGWCMEERGGVAAHVEGGARVGGRGGACWC